VCREMRGATRLDTHLQTYPPSVAVCSKALKYV
jgi:hypothetical protein